MTHGICAVADCGGRLAGQGSCSKHYQRLRNTGSVHLKQRPKVCTIDGCDRRVYYRAMCSMHVTRLERHGDPLYVEGGPEATAPRPNWSGDDATYRAMHKRLERTLGKAADHTCVDCDSQARHWSYTYGSPTERLSEHGFAYSPDMDYYVPRCHVCHKRFDNQHRAQTVLTIGLLGQMLTANTNLETMVTASCHDLHGPNGTVCGLAAGHANHHQDAAGHQWIRECGPDCYLLPDHPGEHCTADGRYWQTEAV